RPVHWRIERVLQDPAWWPQPPHPRRHGRVTDHLGLAVALHPLEARRPAESPPFGQSASTAWSGATKLFRPPKRPHGTDVGVKSGSAYAEPLTDVGDGDFRIGEQCFCFPDFLLVHGRAAAAFAAARPGSLEPGNGSFDQLTALVFRED